jgi:hypothetical protein
VSVRDWKGLLPHEHGSWAYILGPQIAALLASRTLAPPLLWCAGSLLLFCAFQGFAAALRRKELWSASGTIAAASGIALVLGVARGMPIVLVSFVPGGFTAILGILGRRGRLGRQALLEILGITSLSLQGGAALLLGSGSFGSASLLAIASTAYFLLSLIWVRVRLASEIPGRTPLLRRGWNIPASLLLLIVSAVAGLGIGRSLCGFLPGIYLGRLLLPVPRRADGRIRIPRLGVQEAVAASVFAIGLGLFLPR